MAKELIDFETVYAEAHKVVAEYGEDYKYQYVEFEDAEGVTQTAESCVYAAKDGTPSCIVGVISSRLAPEYFSAVAALDWGDTNTYAPRSEAVKATNADHYYDSEAIHFLARAQYLQDEGNPWGLAVMEAKASVLKYCKW